MKTAASEVKKGPEAKAFGGLLKLEKTGCSFAEGTSPLDTLALGRRDGFQTSVLQSCKAKNRAIVIVSCSCYGNHVR